MSIIKYFTKMGDQDVSNMFTPYIWKDHGLDSLLDNKIGKYYGSDLSLILIQYYVEGKFETNGPRQPKVSNYSKKGKDIAVAISVTKNLFHNKNEFERREFIIDSTLNAIKLVKEKLLKKKLNIEFDKLINDVSEVAQIYLKHSKPYVE